MTSRWSVQCGNMAPAPPWAALAFDVILTYLSSEILTEYPLKNVKIIEKLRQMHGAKLCRIFLTYFRR